MAKKKGSNEPKLNYKTELRLAGESGPARLYVLSGTEDYLREYFLSSLKKIVLPEGEDSFSFRRLNGPDIDAQTLREAVDAAPFLTERSRSGHLCRNRYVPWLKAGTHPASYLLISRQQIAQA